MRPPLSTPFLGLLCLCGALAQAAEPPLAPSELTLTSGLVVSGTTYGGGASAAPFIGAALGGRLVLAERVALELEGLSQTPTLANGPRASWTLLARAGIDFPRVLVTAGLLVNASDRSAGVQLLPSVTAAAQLGPVVASVGLFDRLGLAPAHLSVSWHELGVGWVFPLGGEVFARVPLTRELRFEARLLGFSLLGAFSAAGLVGLAWSPR